MNEFKLWIKETPSKDGWWLLKSSLPNDSRPGRVLAKFNTKEEAEHELMDIYSRIPL